MNAISNLPYPETVLAEDMETVAGLSFPDPYRWLEQNSAATAQWQQQQSALIKHWRNRALADIETVKNRLSDFAGAGGAVPRRANQQWFRLHSPAANSANSANSMAVVVANTPYGKGRPVYTTNKLTSSEPENGETSETLVWFSPSPNGAILALGLCCDGSENNRIQLIEVATGAIVPNAPRQLLIDNWTGGVSWLPDSSGFYFLAIDGEPADFRQRLWLHTLADGRQTAVNLPLSASAANDYTLISYSPDGRYHIAHRGLFQPRPVAVLDTEQPQPQWRPFIHAVTDSIAGYTVIDQQLIAVTDNGAPRGRVVSIPLDCPAPDDPANWTELIAESDAVIQSITRIDKHFIISELVDTYSQLSIASLQGKRLKTVALPEYAVIEESVLPLTRLLNFGADHELLLSCSSLVQSSAVYRYNPASQSLDLLLPPAISLDKAIIEDHWAEAADGTLIPYHSLRLATTDPGQPQPTLIYAYGSFGFNAPAVYSKEAAAFIAAGGIYIHGHLRGGSELGRDWADAGMGQYKANSYQDLYTIAEDLIGAGQTRPDLLALHGRSAGGLMAGVALTQRPELWRVVIPEVPVLDLLAAFRDPYSAWCNQQDRGSREKRDDITRIVLYSPYHTIHKGTDYPAVMVVAGATDPRCPPWHARKFIARLQAATNGGVESPVLVHIWEQSGHGSATPAATRLTQTAEWLTFVMQQLGMECP